MSKTQTVDSAWLAQLRSEFRRYGAEVERLKLELERSENRIGRWQELYRDSWEAICAMRNDINEFVPMPSVEADLLRGPEISLSCEIIAASVMQHFADQKGQPE